MSTNLQRRRRAQRGSVLSGLLIIVAFLSILGSALMSEISSQFLMTRNLVDQVTAEATVQSGMENAIAQLQGRVVPFRCSTDQPSPIGPISVNMHWTAANQIACRSIVPDVASALPSGASNVDGTHVTIGSHNVYLASDGSGNLYSYSFGQTSLAWSIPLGRNITAPPVERSGSGYYVAAVPTGSSVTLVNDWGSGASGRCSMASGNTVSGAAFGTGTNFPTYTFFGDASGRLYVYDSNCQAPIGPSVPLGGRIVGSPLVLQGTVTTNTLNNGGACSNGNNGGDNDDRVTTTTAEVFVLVTSGGSSSLVESSFAEDRTGNNTQDCWVPSVNRRSLSFGGSVGLSFYASGGTQLAAITFAGGQLQLASITASSARGGSSGFTYSMSRSRPLSLGGSFSRAPGWSSGGQVGAADGQSLFVFDSGLRQLYRFDGPSAINTTPAADIHGDWYFGADDGYVYDVEPPAAGTQAMFQAARFGPGGPVQGSPVVGSPSDGCSGNVCMYFGSASTGSYFVQIGNIRVMELRSCMTSGTSSTACIQASATNPSLWARLEVGDPAYMSGRTVNVIGWSYSNGP